MGERAKAWICRTLLARIAAAGGMVVCLSLVNIVCCQVEVSAMGRSLVQRSPIECSVSDCGQEA